jgi:predicted O-methyltransferase YrrM
MQITPSNEEIRRRLGGIPHMTLPQADRIREFAREHGLAEVIELGTFHGVSTCYLAAAAAENGGRVITMDLESARSLTPNVEELLERVGLRDHVEVFYEPTSYTWRLMKMLEADPEPRYDLCYLDGAHSWFVDGFAFFLVDRLFRPGGWIIFDDMEWTYAASPALRDTDMVRRMPREERETPQVRQVFDLLVRPHPAYDRFIEDGNWAYARKRLDINRGTPAIRTEVVIREVGIGTTLRSVLRSLRGRLA